MYKENMRRDIMRPEEINSQLELQIKREKLDSEMQKSQLMLQVKRERLEQARLNLLSLMMLEEKGRKNLDSDIENILEIMREVNQIGSDSIIVKDKIQTTKDILESFSLTENDIQKAIRNTNIFAIIRKAKENGYELKISDNEVALYKNGVRVVCKDNVDTITIIPEAIPGENSGVKKIDVLLPHSKSGGPSKAIKSKKSKK